MRVPRAAIRFGAAAFAAACGARTALFVGEAPSDAGADVRDVTTPDVADVRTHDVLPPIDAMHHDVIMPPPACADAGSTLVYLITEQNVLLSFYPPTLAFTPIGTIACPTATATPYSMGVDRKGIAYSVFNDGTLFRIDTATAACATTSYVPGQLGWMTFGMGYVADVDAGGENLYVTEANFNMPSQGLGTIDTDAGRLSIVGPFSTPLPRCELTGTGDGRLFAFCLNQNGPGSTLAQIDPATARVLAADPLMVGSANEGFAFAFWGGDFWIFTGTTQSTTVTQYDPVAKTLATATTYGGTIVGAGVSTCAPQ